MWERLNIFGWNKKPTPQPVQREVKINITNGDTLETIQRSPSGTKIGSSSVARNRFDDDESSDGSTSINFGLKVGPSPRRASSFSFSREPMDLPTWSNVTSPGFTSRLVQQASGNSPLKEYNDSLSHSPFRKSPHKNLGLGELPFVNFSRKPRLSSPSSFPSPSSPRSLRPGVTSSMYNRDRRRNARQGQVFVRIAPIDPSIKANVSIINRKSSTPPVGMGNNSPFPPRGSPRAGSEPYRPDGLGGIPQQELAMRFNRMWPNAPGSPSPGPGRPLSPTAPSNIMEALASGRKRGREQDVYYPGPPNATPPSVSPPSKISIGIGDTPVRPHQMPKRVKFIGSHEVPDRPMMVPFTGIGGGDHEPLSSESILEQMNQTEKRFLPDSTSTPYSLQKKPIRMSEEPSTSGNCVGSNGLRKRRSQTNVMNAIEEEARGEKFGRYCCPCNECYAEATGNNSLDQSSFMKDGSSSPGKSGSEDKSPSKNSSTMKETCDIGIGTDNDRGAYFRELFRKAEKKKKTEADPLEAEIFVLPKTVYTKEKYDRDKQKRIERYYRILKLKPPGGSIFDKTGEFEDNKIRNHDDTSLSSSSAANGKVSSEPAPALTGASTGFSFGATAAPVSSAGFSFGKQGSPVALTVTTNACPTITSPSVTGMFGAGSVSSTASTSAPLNTSLGITGSSPASSTVATASTVSAGTSSPTLTLNFGVGSAHPTGGINFSSGTNTPATSQPITKETLATTTSATTAPTTGTGGFSFSGGSSPPSFGGFGATSQPSVTSAAPAFPGFGLSSTVVSSVGSSSASAPDSTDSAKPSGTSTAPPVSSSSGFSFGSGGASTTSTTAGTFGSPPSTVSSPGGFNFSSVPNPLAANKNPTSEAPPAFGGFGSTTSTTSTTTPATTASAFGSFGGTKSPPVFGGGNNNNTGTNQGFSFGQNTTSQPQSQASSGGFGFGSGAQTTTPAQTASTGFAFGQSSAQTANGKVSNEPAPAVTGASTGFSFGATSPAFSFGKQGSQMNAAPNTTSSSVGMFGAGIVSTTAQSSAPLNTSLGITGSSNQATASTISAGASTPTVNFGVGSAHPPGGINFSSGTNPSATTQPNTKETLTITSANTAPTTGTGGFSFSGGPSPPSFGGFGATSPPSVTTAAPAFPGFGLSSAAPPVSTSNVFSFASGGASSTTGTFGSPPSTVTSPSGGFNFSSVPNPLAGNKNSTSGAPPVFGGFGSTTANTSTTTPSTTASAFGSFGGTTSSSIFGGGNNNNTANQGFSFGQSTMSPPQSQTGSGGFGSTTANTSTTTPATTASAFGSFGGTTSPPIFGGGSNNNAGTNQGFSFGQNTMSPPQSQTGSGGFGFGSGAQTTTPAQPASTGFAFGQSSAPAAPVPQPSPAGVFTFGQQPQQQNTGSAPFQFGQQAAQGVPGGFNFAAAAPAGGGQPMFSVGTSSTLPRRRDPRRRHR